MKLYILIILWKILPCRLWSLSRQRRPSRPSGANYNVSVDVGTEISRSYGSGDVGDGWWCPINHRHGDSHTIRWILSMIRGWNDCRCRSGRRFRRKVTLMMMRSLLLMVRWVMRMLLLRLLLLVLVIGYCSRKLGRIVSGGAWIYWSIVTFIIHLDAKTLEFLSSISLHCVGLLEARQRCRAANKNIYHILYRFCIVKFYHSNYFDNIILMIKYK